MAGPDTPPAAVVETHVSWVFFVGDGAFKLKKPVRTPFLDFSTVERRRLACEEEVRLNRRLAPDVYRGVMAVVGPEGTACDHLVAMRRLPEDRRLSSLVERGSEGLEVAIDAIAAALVRFHNGADRSGAIDDAATVEALGRNWEANTAELGAYAGTVLERDTIDEVQALAARYLDGRRPLLDERIAAGRIVDGHGDLLADDVFVLDDGPRLLDCLEFDSRLRHGDVLADVAFLAMDLERLGRNDLATRLLERHRDGLGDDWPSSLAHHYLGYRAQVRAKVAGLRWAQGDRAAAGAARDLMDLSRRHLCLGEVRLLLVGGLPGTGKTTVSAALGETFGLTVLRSDLVRQELAGPGARSSAGYRSGPYDPAVTDLVYVELLDRARGLMSRGRSVVIDASWGAARHRAQARRLAASCGAALVELRCDAPASVTNARMARRMGEGTDASDATPEIAAAMAADVDPWPEARILDTAAEPSEVARAASALTGIPLTVGALR